jgi:hypothetical protein
LQFTRLVNNLASEIFPEPSSKSRAIAGRGFLFSRRGRVCLYGAFVIELDTTLFISGAQAQRCQKLFRVGNATFGAREGAHDDLVLAVALAVYGLTLPEMTVEPLSC